MFCRHSIQRGCRCIGVRYKITLKVTQDFLGGTDTGIHVCHMVGLIWKQFPLMDGGSWPVTNLSGRAPEPRGQQVCKSEAAERDAVVLSQEGRESTERCKPLTGRRHEHRLNPLCSSSWRPKP